MSEPIPLKQALAPDASSSGVLTAPAAPTEPAAPSADTGAEPIKARVLRVAWMAILLGFAIEVLLLAAAVALNTYQGPRPFLADLAQKVTWSVVVCVGLALGTTVAKARPPVMGLLGLAAAPLAFQVAKMVHRGMAQALSLAGAGTPFVTVVLLGALKSLEYGALGWSVGRVGQRFPTLTAHAGIGLAVGLTFGLGLTFLTAQTPAGLAPLPEVVARGINEVLFPVGCALVLFAAEVLGKRLE